MLWLKLGLAGRDLKLELEFVQKNTKAGQILMRHEM